MYTLEQIKAATVTDNELPFEYTKAMNKCVYYSGYDDIRGPLPNLKSIKLGDSTTHPAELQPSKLTIIGFNASKRMVVFDKANSRSGNPWYMKLSDMIKFGVIEATDEIGTESAPTKRVSKKDATPALFKIAESDLILL